jgi:hypothetical protein
MSQPPEIKNGVRHDLEAGRSEFHQLLGLVRQDAWQRPSRNRGWTNGQLLFHIALGFFLVVPLFVVMRLFAALPRPMSKVFARCLNAATPLFNWINALGPRFGARVLNSRRLGRTFDAVHRLIVRRVESMRPEDWGRGMHYPTKWEPLFSDFMSFEALFRYPVAHMQHHRTQIDVSNDQPKPQ